MVGTVTVRYGNGKPCSFSFPTASSRPVPSLVSVPAVYHPAVRCLGPVPTVSRPTINSCSHPIPTLENSLSNSIYHRFCRFLIMSPWMQLDYASLDETAVLLVGEGTGGFFVKLFIFLPRLHRARHITQHTKLNMNHSIGRTHS